MQEDPIVNMLVVNYGEKGLLKILTNNLQGQLIDKRRYFK